MCAPRHMTRTLTDSPAKQALIAVGSRQGVVGGWRKMVELWLNPRTDACSLSPCEPADPRGSCGRLKEDRELGGPKPSHRRGEVAQERNGNASEERATPEQRQNKELESTGG